MVLIARTGTRIRAPAISESNCLSYSPLKWATSVLVPPISKVMIKLNPALLLVCTAPTIPPAGPLKMLSLP